MLPGKKRVHAITKEQLHPRNKHRERYNFPVLILSCPELTYYVSVNKYGDESIDFSDPHAVKILNKSLLKYFYGIEHWDIPPGYLCPPIPGRADYMHYAADILANDKRTINKNQIKCLDIGCGANCIYPIIGVTEYGWEFVGSDIDPVAVDSANKIITCNTALSDKIEIRLQKDADHIFEGIILTDDYFHLVICNPPFHSSAEDALSGSKRKVNNLKSVKTNRPVLNFGGRPNELWCKGGEETFLNNMIRESKHFSQQCLWFTTLVSKESHMPKAIKNLEKINADQIRVIPMGQGNKISRILAWTF